MESFANRVDKVFGSLQVTTSSSWRLTLQESHPQRSLHRQRPEGDEQEGDEQEDDEEAPHCASRSPKQHCFFDGMEVEDDLEGEGRAVREMIGLDTTLDNEDEEDEFDKAAFGLDGSEEDRLYMKGIQETKRDPNSAKSLPSSLYDLKNLQRDPRANHSAAKARLEEDAKAVTATWTTVPSMDASHGAKVSDAHVRDANENVREGKRSRENTPASPEAPAASSGETSKPSKRVRFALDPQQKERSDTDTQFMRHKPNSLQASQVPDYVRNPSKYTCYTLDWSVEDNEKSNFEAFQACSETLHEKVEEVYLPEETMQKVQFVRKCDRTTSNTQKISAEEPNRSGIASTRTIRVEHLEGENGNPDDEAMNLKTGDTASSFQKAIEKTAGKSAKSYRTRRDVEDDMDI